MAQTTGDGAGRSRPTPTKTGAKGGNSSSFVRRGGGFVRQEMKPPKKLPNQAKKGGK
jgi:hypothetical protein